MSCVIEPRDVHCPWSSVDGPYSLNSVHFTLGSFLGLLLHLCPPGWPGIFQFFQTSLDTGNSVGGIIHSGVSCSNLFL